MWGKWTAFNNWLTAVRAGRYRQVFGIGMIVAGLSAAIGFLCGYETGVKT
jgi:hypothetical protein